MRAENLRELIRAAPYRPFVIHLANGANPRAAPGVDLSSTRRRTAIVMGSDESIRIIDVALVVELELGPPVPAGSVAPNPDGGE